MIYHIEMTPEQHAWLVETLIVDYVTHKSIPRDDRGIALDQLEDLRDTFSTALPCRPATLEEKRAVLDKIDPDDDNEMDYITEPDGDGGVWFLTWHYIKEEGDDE